jgi:hypothetical protein
LLNSKEDYINKTIGNKPNWAIPVVIPIVMDGVKPIPVVFHPMVFLLRCIRHKNHLKTPVCPIDSFVEKAQLPGEFSAFGRKRREKQGGDKTLNTKLKIKI